MPRDFRVTAAAELIDHLLRCHLVPQRHRLRRREDHGCGLERARAELGVDEPRILEVVIRESQQAHRGEKQRQGQDDLTAREQEQARQRRFAGYAELHSQEENASISFSQNLLRHAGARAEVEID